MGWRTRQRSRMLTAYRTQLQEQQIGQELAFDAKAYQNRVDTFAITAEVSKCDTAFAVPDSYETRVRLSHASVGTVPTHLSPRLVPVMLIEEDDAIVRSVQLDQFPCLVHRFSFQRTKKEPRTSLFQGQRQSRTRLKVPRVRRPPTPPSMMNADLEEKLRWILTPPIHELLSDPQLCLPAKPFPFQTHGIWWLYERENGLLADEMGLGKTMQAIIAARLLWREQFINQILVVCPKTLIPTWQSEIDKWWPQVNQNVMLPGSDRQFFLRLGTPNAVIKIINYEAIAREAEWLKDQAFSHDLIIIDEAQKIKNSKSKTAQAVTSLKAGRRWALTGTPLENKVDDVRSIFQFVRDELDTSDDPASLGRQIAPYTLRRRTEEVIDDLPDKSEHDIAIDLDSDQRRAYEQMEEEGVLQLNARGDSITVTHVFSLITKLRQICNFDPVAGKSAKLERLLEDLEEVRESGRKALVFSQFVGEPYGLKRIARELENAGCKTLQLHGEIRQSQRNGVLEVFKGDASIDALLLNYRVGGVGLNLQAANYVFLFDRWWNPAVEDQAVKRAHRIGQTHKVFIRRFYCKDTVEERILKKLAEKRRLFRNVIDQARPDPDSFGLTEEEIFSLFNLTVRPKRKAAASPGKVRINLDNMDPSQFEELVAELYEKRGYTVQLTAGSHDEGIDIFAERTAGGALERVIVQCKHHQVDNKVGRPILQQLWGVVSSDQSYTRGDLVTSSYFTSEAEGFAEGKRLTLIDRDLLIKLAHQFEVADFGSASV